MDTTTICLVRHGETEWNASGRIQGQLDTALSETGHAQAQAVAGVLGGRRFDAVYASDLVRVRDTAAPTLARIAMHATELTDLRERHYGKFQEHTYAEARVLWPDDFARFEARDPEFGFDTGERLKDFYARSVACLEALVERHRGASVLVFTHGGVLDMIYRRAHRRDVSSPRDFATPNAALNWIDAGGEEWRVRVWADCSHLDRALDDF